MKHVNDEIGNQYERWQRWENIFISAPTGSGKTTFVLEELYDFAVRTQQRILYLVNRKILLAQIEDEIKKQKIKLQKKYALTSLDQNVIEVKTYQQIEKTGYPIGYIEEQYGYVIADECHYFLNDSLFNPNTYKSYAYIMKSNACHVFISATIDRIKDYIIEKEIEDGKKSCIQKVNGIANGKSPSRGTNKVVLDSPFQWSSKSYDGECNYEHIQLNMLKDDEHMLDVISRNKNEKWLIFVDSKGRGRKLEKRLREIDIQDVVFIDASTDIDSEGGSAIEKIIEKRKLQNLITITTSVMDNGISLVDDKLKNIVIITNTKEEFIQMLGRKRNHNENDTLSVYILKKSGDSFSSIRERYIQRMLEVLTSFEIGTAYWCECILEQCLKSEFFTWVVRNTCYIDYYYGRKAVFVNPFSLLQLQYLDDCYEELINNFVDDEFAYIRKQAAWIGKEDVADLIIATGNDQINLRNREKIEDKLQVLSNECAGHQELIDEAKRVISSLSGSVKESNSFEEIKAKIKEQGLHILKDDFVMFQKNYHSLMSEMLKFMDIRKESDEWETILSNLSKHCLTEEMQFNKVLDTLKLPFCLKVTGGGKVKGSFYIYEIKRKES